MVGSAPTGACVNGVAGQLVIATGAIYTCQGGTWGVSGSGSGIPVVLPNGSTATTQPNPYDVSTNIATDSFVVRSVVLQMATTPISNVTGGMYSFDSQGTGALVNYAVTNGAISSITTWIPFVGSGYAIGDVITPQAGNYDALIVVTGLSGSIPNAGTILYGGTGYSSGTSVALSGANAVQFTFLLSGTLTSNATFIMPYGSYLTTSNQWFWANNTTGAFTVSVCQAGATNACSGGRSVANLPQGTNNSCIEILNTDGILNVDSIYSTCPSTVSGGSELTVTALATPTNGTSSTANSGGTLTGNTTYYYRVWAIDSAAAGSCAGTAGSTLPSTEKSQLTATGNNLNTVTVTWNPVANAAGYCVAGRTTGAELLMTPTPLAANVLTFTDTNSVTPSGALPDANTTGVIAVGTNNPVTIGGATGSCTGKFAMADGTGCNTPSGTLPAGSTVSGSNLRLPGNASTGGNVLGSSPIAGGGGGSIAASLGSATPSYLPIYGTVCSGTTCYEILHLTANGSTGTIVTTSNLAAQAWTVAGGTGCDGTITVTAHSSTPDTLYGYDSPFSAACTATYDSLTVTNIASTWTDTTSGATAQVIQASSTGGTMTVIVRGIGSTWPTSKVTATVGDTFTLGGLNAGCNGTYTIASIPAITSSYVFVVKATTGASCSFVQPNVQWFAPSMVTDQSGNLWMFAQGGNGNGGGLGLGTNAFIGVSKSTNGGSTWSAWAVLFADTSGTCSGTIGISVPTNCPVYSQQATVSPTGNLIVAKWSVNSSSVGSVSVSWCAPGSSDCTAAANWTTSTFPAAAPDSSAWYAPYGNGFATSSNMYLVMPGGSTCSSTGICELWALPSTDGKSFSNATAIQITDGLVNTTFGSQEQTFQALDATHWFGLVRNVPDVHNCGVTGTGSIGCPGANGYWGMTWAYTANGGTTWTVQPADIPLMQPICGGVATLTGYQHISPTMAAHPLANGLYTLLFGERQYCSDSYTRSYLRALTFNPLMFTTGDVQTLDASTEGDNQVGYQAAAVSGANLYIATGKRISTTQALLGIGVLIPSGTSVLGVQAVSTLPVAASACYNNPPVQWQQTTGNWCYCSSNAWTCVSPTLPAPVNNAALLGVAGAWAASTLFRSPLLVRTYGIATSGTAPYYAATSGGSAGTLSGTSAAAGASLTTPGFVKLTNTITQYSCAGLSVSPLTYTARSPQAEFDFYFPGAADISGAQIWAGFLNDVTCADLHNTSNAYTAALRYIAGTDSTFKLVTQGASSVTTVDTGITPTATTYYKFVLQLTTASATLFQLSGSTLTQVAQSTTNLPTSSTGLYVGVYSVALNGSAATNIDTSWIGMTLLNPY